MRKVIWLILLTLIMMLCLTAPCWATPPPGLTPALDSIKATIDGLATTDEIKAQLKTISEERLGEAAEQGFTAEQLQALADQMGVLYGQVGLARDLPYLDAAWQFMIEQMDAGLSPADTEAMLSTELAAGADLKTALETAGFTPDDTGDNNNVDNGNINGNDNNGGNDNIDNGNANDNDNSGDNDDNDNGNANDNDNSGDNDNNDGDNDNG